MLEFAKMDPMTYSFSRPGMCGVLWLLLAMSCAFALAGCGSGYAHPALAIATLPTEDLVGPCRYELVQDQSPTPVNGVLVIFERADTVDLFEDASLRTTAAQLHYSILWAHECDGISNGDLQADASKGPARVLQAAMQTFAAQSGHPELATGPVILYGFSAAGVLSLTMENVMPERLIGVIAFASGSGSTNLDQVEVTPAAAAIPTLLLGNGNDDRSGTSRSTRYFDKGRALRGPWGYAVQNGTGHCCTLSTRKIIEPWITAIAATGAKKRSFGDAGTTLASFDCIPDGAYDSQNEQDCSFQNVSLGPATSNTQRTGWLPDAASGAAWLAWVTNPGTND